MKMFFLILMVVLTAVGCADQSVEKYKERGVAEQEGSKKVENENLAQKAEIMERDLSQRHVFYSAMEGEYQGTVKALAEQYKIKLILTRSIPPYTGSRVRNLSEIETDLNNLFFYAKVVQWHPSDQNTAVGCQIDGARPNMDTGIITLSSNTCPNFYQIVLSENGIFDLNVMFENAKIVAKKINSSQLTAVPFFLGTIQTSNNAVKYTFIAQKTK